jgi:hypothetical protein
MKSTWFLASVVAAVALFVCAGDLSAAPVVLGGFTPDPASAVDFSPDGLSATLKEDQIQGPVSLEDLSYVFPAGASTLSFDYDFHVAAGGRDFFDFYIGSAAEPVFEIRGIAPLVTSGSFMCDVSALAGMTAPIVFDLMPDWDDDDFNSFITISNVQISCIPIPGTLWLLGSGLLSIIGLIRKKGPEKDRRSFVFL